MTDAGRKRLISILVILLIYMIVLFAVISFRSLSFMPAEPAVVETTETPVVQPQPIDMPPPIAVEAPLETPFPIIEEPAPVEPEPVMVTTGPEPVTVTTEPPSESQPVQKIPENVIMPVEETVAEEPLPEETPYVEPDPWADFVTVEEDPWADFYVAGEEDYSIFSDGTYLVPLIVNDEYLTDINVTFTTDALFLEVNEFRAVISDLLVDDFEAQLFATTETRFSLDYLQSQGIDAWYDYTTFELYMNFPSWMMPVRVLSINRGNVVRYNTYSMTGSTPLEPARFSWFTNLSLYSLIDLNKATGWQPNIGSLLTMQAQNSIALYDVAFDFSYTVHPGRGYSKLLADPWSDDISDYITFHGIQGFYDIKPKSLRFFFGNVNDYLGLSKDSIGLGVEKRYNYGDIVPKSHQFEYSVTVEEPSTVEVFINERSVYRRELQAGIYKLRDFMFTQGANDARVVVTPLADPSREQELFFVLGYDSRLLARGDTLYSLSLTFPETNIARTTFRANQQLGLTDTITGSYAFALSPSAITLGFSGTFATRFGSFDSTIASSYSGPLGFGISSRLNYRIAGREDSPFGSFDTSLGFSTRNYNTSLQVSPTAIAGTGDTYDLSASYSGSVGKALRYSFGGSLNWLTSQVLPTWRLTASAGIPLIPNMSISGSVSIYTNVSSPVPQVRGQLSMNYAFTPNLSMSASSDLVNSTYLSASWKPFGSQNNSFQFSFSNLDFTDPLGHQGSVSFSHSDKAYGLSVRQQYGDHFSRFSTSISLNTSIAYAKGMLGITRSIGDNFLLVRPTGALKGSDIAVTRTMTSEPTALPSLFGVGTYSAITSHQQNNVVVYGIGESLFNNSGSYIYDFLPRPRQGYAVTVSSEMTYSIVGTLLRSPTAAYSRYTTDLFRVQTSGEGEEELVFDETLYLFTDESGFFFLSGVQEGTYQFSLFLPNSADDEPPVDIRFTLESDGKAEEPQVFVLDTFVASDISYALEQEFYDSLMGIETESKIFDENGYYWLDVTESMDETSFWDSYYPKRMILESVTGEQVEATGDALVEMLSSQKQELTAVERMARERQQELFNLARLRSIIKPYLDAAAPKEGWRPSIP